jgi:TusA-related sulfurtransferase
MGTEMDINDPAQVEELAEKIAKMLPGEKLTVTFENKGVADQFQKSIQKKLAEKQEKADQKAEAEDPPPDIPAWT